MIDGGPDPALLSQSDNYWLNTRTPCLTYGLRGICYYKLTISGPARDLHSGVFGRTIHEPMVDLITLLSKLVTPSGEILIPGVNELVAPLTDEERKRYEVIDYSIQDIEDSVGAKITITNDKAQALMGRMRYPSLSLRVLCIVLVEVRLISTRSPLPSRSIPEVKRLAVHAIRGRNDLDQVSASYLDGRYLRCWQTNKVRQKTPDD